MIIFLYVLACLKRKSFRAQLYCSSVLPAKFPIKTWESNSHVVRTSLQLKILLMPTGWMIKRYDVKWIKYVNPKFVLKVFNQLRFQWTSVINFLFLKLYLCVHRQKWSRSLVSKENPGAKKSLNSFESHVL